MNTAKIVFLFGTISVALSGCNDEPREAPSATYQRYYDLVINGRSFEDDIVFHSSARRKDILSRVDKDAQARGMTAKDFKSMYLKFTRKLAECGTLSLKTEQVDGDAATLIYKVEDTCTDMSSENTLTIEMVHEDGWKIKSDTQNVKS